jgi:hypothetical protein
LSYFWHFFSIYTRKQVKLSDKKQHYKLQCPFKSYIHPGGVRTDDLLFLCDATELRRHGSGITLVVCPKHCLSYFCLNLKHWTLFALSLSRNLHQTSSNIDYIKIWMRRARVRCYDFFKSPKNFAKIMAFLTLTVKLVQQYTSNRLPKRATL